MQERVRPEAVEAGEPASAEARRGFFFALSAYGLWGFLPFYMKAVSHIPAVEVVAHRVIWSVPLAGLVLLVLGRTGDIRMAFRQPRMLGMAALTAAIISVNWGIYVWAIAVDRTVETALGYYINPLVTVLLGSLLLGEKLNRYQVVAVALAVAAVAVLTVEAGGLPWVSLVLALTFAAYGYLRKTLPVGPSQGFFLEVLILSIPCLAYVGWLETTGQGHFFGDGGENIAMLLLAGPITAIPLILYAFGAKLLRISTIGIMQYVSPTMIALIAVFAFGEPFGLDRMIAFGLIWSALALYTWSMFFGAKKS
ncbi:EamA family transporter RarD [Mesorhizobium microcysteis]|uniref:EamA family transporter RarD n=1 Tax=Neoaquamicrobium microcysteis TaxID=2682781 RepID=A0A5D4GV94_9HYPH|nr:EamA family transporter RarD [Mesorhizobium microcysteis]TYR32791.1 EamA family transporter RarD [Mesorhizobium microcysteis]